MKSKPFLHCVAASLAVTAFVALDCAVVSTASARSPRSAMRYDLGIAPGTPVLAVVALREQHVSIYDANGKILESPVSTGATGYETPAGIYSIVQKEEEHHSNLYDDASMPFMERITWTGMALHAGVLPGYAASHGCVRMPYAFAEQLYGLTQLGMRVVVVREDIAPVDITQPALFNPRATSQAGNGPDHSSLETPRAAINVSITPSDSGLMERLRMSAAAKSAAAEAASRREKEARKVLAKATAEIAPAQRAVRDAEAAVTRAEAELKAAEHALETANTPDKPAPPERITQLETAKTQAAGKVDAAKVRLQEAQAQVQAKGDAVSRAQQEVQDATVAMNLAADAAEEAQQNLSPVSVFISRKMQRLYIRKGTLPVYEGPVTIRDSDKQIGTFVFTALNYTDTPGVLRWNVVSMYKNATNIEPYVKENQGKREAPGSAAPADVNGAQAALDRITVPNEAAVRIASVVLPGSSLIISDEGPSVEIGKDTDFIVFMSGEPQGGIAIRQHNKSYKGEQDDFIPRLSHWFGDDDPPRRSRSRSGGFPFFFGD